MSARLSSDRLGGIETGYYLAGDNLPFTLEPYGDKYLLRFPAQPEVYVLYVDHGLLGGKVLKYDAGGVALRVSAWGGMTLYTDSAPQGLPTVKNDAPSKAQRVTAQNALPDLSLADLQKAASDETAHLAYSRKLKVAVSADWNTLPNDSNLRGMLFDAMENAVRGIDRFTVEPNARERFAERVDSMRMTVSRVPTLALRGKTLVVTFVPENGYAGRASSRAIAQALAQVLKTGKR